MNKELQFLIYNTPQGNVKVDVVVKDETIWLTQKAMASLFDVQVPAISKHLKKIFEEGELNETVVVSKMEITTVHGAMIGKTQTQEANFYNLDAINEFLVFRKYQILTDKGSISKHRADDKARKKYDEFNKHQKINSGFDKQVKRLGQGGKA